MQYLSVKNLNLEKNSRLILKDISFDVEKGSYIGIIGPNGAGKSTLIKCISGIETSFSGSIYKSPELVIGYVPQNYNLPEHVKISVQDVISMGANLKNFSNYLSLVGLTLDILDKDFTKLSGGQKQRIIICRALMCDPNLLLFDEPFSGVDQKTKLELYDLLKDLNTKNNITIIFVSHEVSQVINNCHKIICLDQTIHEGCHPVNFSTGDKSDCNHIKTSNFSTIHHHNH